MYTWKGFLGDILIMLGWGGWGDQYNHTLAKPFLGQPALGSGRQQEGSTILRMYYVSVPWFYILYFHFAYDLMRACTLEAADS